MTHRRALALIDLIAGTASAVVLAGVGVAAIQNTSVMDHIARDAKQLQQIGSAMRDWAEQHEERYPIPSLEDREPIKMPDGTSQRLLGRGKPIWSTNTTGNLYSMMIMQRYLDPSHVVSPLEVSRLIVPKSDYAFDAYSPHAEPFTLWDVTFHVDPGNVTTTSNASYANQALCGRRLIMKWNDSRAGSDWPMLSLRGPRDGATQGAEFDQSPTLRFMPLFDQWNSNVLFADQSVRPMNSVELEAGGTDTNMFAGDDPKGESPWMGVFIQASQNSATPTWDPLLPRSVVEADRRLSLDAKRK